MQSIVTGRWTDNFPPPSLYRSVSGPANGSLPQAVWPRGLTLHCPNLTSQQDYGELQVTNLRCIKPRLPGRYSLTKTNRNTTGEGERTLEWWEIVDGEDPLVHHHDHEGRHTVEHRCKDSAHRNIMNWNKILGILCKKNVQFKAFFKILNLH